MRRGLTGRSRRLAAVTAGLLLLTACGGDGAEAEEAVPPPESYAVSGEETLPSLTQAIPPIDMEGVTYTPPGAGDEDAEDAPAETGEIYRYGGLEDAGELAGRYVADLEERYGCAVVTEEGVETSPPDFSQPEGSVLVGKAAADETGTLLLELAWTEDGCTVTRRFQEGLAITAPEPVTLADAVERIESRTPASLGLPGESMVDYYVWAEEGLVLLDGVQCIRVGVYTEPDHAPAGTYLVAADGNALYRLDRETGQVTPLAG